MNASSFGRGGMQVHAVPVHERHVDSSGRRLPWAYVGASRTDATDNSASGASKKEERGSFGRPVRRRGTSRSRSKTAEPMKDKDRAKMENQRMDDAIFSRLRSEGREQEKGKSGAVVGKDQGAVATNTKAPEVKEPTEVLLYGFGDDLQWAAIDFYECASCGIILEDYEREPPGQRQDISRSYTRMTAQKSLSKAHMRKKNTFHGGNHWIKVTFDSPEAADLACARSPHLIKGHYVYAEPYRGSGPSTDEPLYTMKGGANKALERSRSQGNNLIDMSPESSETLSSQTVNGFPRQAQPPARPIFETINQTEQQASSTALQQRDGELGMELQPRSALISGVTRAKLLPPELALMPKQPKQSWSAWLSGSEVIGSTLPRKEDGTFDYDRASFYWRLFYWLDVTFGFDFCGLKAEE